MRPSINIRHAASAMCGAVVLVGAGPSVAADETDWRASVMSAAADLLEESYIYEDTGSELAAYLRDNAQVYAGVDDKAAFAQALTAALYEIANDRHLRFAYVPLEEESEPPADESPQPAPYCRTTTIGHQRLEGDVGYIRIPRFDDDPAYLARFDAAMEELADVEALVLDLRGNCGGRPNAVQHVSTYFFAEPTVLIHTERRGGPTSERMTLEDAPGPRFVDRPVYILTANDTFSAAESFAFGMRDVTSRAVIVGARTRGGGHFGGWRELEGDFAVWVPVGRAFNPHTGLGWEAEGLQPDIETTAGDALDAALADFAER